THRPVIYASHLVPAGERRQQERVDNVHRGAPAEPRPHVTAPIADTEPQTAGGKVVWHSTMSLDGFVAGPNHAMDWITGTSFRPGLSRSTPKRPRGAGRSGSLNAYPDVSVIYGGARQGPVFVLTHHPED